MLQKINFTNQSINYAPKQLFCGNTSTNTLERTPHTDEVKKNKKNNTNKILLTVGALVTAGTGIIYAIKKCEVKNIKNIQEAFQNVFLRDDISVEDAKAMLKRYQDIEKITDKKEYIKALFEEATKNYRLDDYGIKLVFDQPCEGARNAVGFYNDSKRLLSIDTNRPNGDILNTMHHELRHAIQHRAERASDMVIKIKALMYSYACEFVEKGNLENIDMEKLSREWLDRAKKELKEKGFPNTEEMLERYNFVKNKEFKNNKTIIQFPEKHSDWVEKCAEHAFYGDKTMPDENFAAYFERFSEKDARWAGKTAKRFIKGNAFSFW